MAVMWLWAKENTLKNMSIISSTGYRSSAKQNTTHLVAPSPLDEATIADAFQLLLMKYTIRVYIGVFFWYRHLSGCRIKKWSFCLQNYACIRMENFESKIWNFYITTVYYVYSHRDTI
jgi:hypothetical protein